MADEDMREWLSNYILVWKLRNLSMSRDELISSILFYPIAAPICLILICFSLIATRNNT